MGRWEPGARGRLEDAALELYAEHGFDRTTVAQIAERAGVTERTFYRHFADKREVLFAGGQLMEERLAAAVTDAPPDASAYDVVAAALDGVATVLTERRRDAAARRQAVIESHRELRERELGKLAAWAAALTRGLVDRGLEPRVASLVAQAGVAVFRVAFEAWVADPDRQDLAVVLSASFEELRRAVTPLR